MTRTKTRTNIVLGALSLLSVLALCTPAPAADQNLAEHPLTLTVAEDGEPLALVSGSRRPPPKLQELPRGTVLRVTDLPPGKSIDILGLRVASETTVLLTDRGPRLIESGAIFITEGVTAKDGGPGRMPVLVQVHKQATGKLRRWCLDSAILGIDVFNGLRWRWRSDREDLCLTLSRQVGTAPYKCESGNVTCTCAIAVPHWDREKGEKGVILILGKEQCAPGFFPAFVLSEPHWVPMPTVVSDDAVISGIIHGATNKNLPLAEDKIELLRRAGGVDFGADLQKWAKWWQDADVDPGNR